MPVIVIVVGVAALVLSREALSSSASAGVRTVLAIAQELVDVQAIAAVVAAPLLFTNTPAVGETTKALVPLPVVPSPPELFQFICWTAPVRSEDASGATLAAFVWPAEKLMPMDAA